MEICYSHGDLLASQSAESIKLSPRLPQAHGILHDLSLNLSRSSQYLESQYQLDLFNFPEVLALQWTKGRYPFTTANLY